MATYEEQIFPGFEEELQSCPPEFTASPQVVPGSVEARMMSVGSGRQCSMWLDASSPLGVFSKILLESLAWGNSGEFCYVWERLDTRFGCSAFRLTRLGQSTCGSGCSLFATPNTLDALEAKNQEALDRERFRDNRNRLKPDNLRDQVAVRAGLRLWRTPDASMTSGGAANGEARLEQGHALGLHDQANTPKLWPTVPNGGRRNPEGTSITGKKPDGGKAQMDLREFAVRQTEATGSLNAEFVSWLMGFPAGWTALKCPFRSPGSGSRTGRSE